MESFNHKSILSILVVLVIGVQSCGDSSEPVLTGEDKKNTYFELLDVADSGVDFNNRVKDEEDFNVLTYRNYYNGGGVGIGDLNNDGLPDLYFTSNRESNKLYLNKGDLKFEDITVQAGVGGDRGWCTGVSIVDINADGWLDIYVSNSGDLSGDNKENELYINNGLGSDGSNVPTFTEKAQEYGLANQGYSTQASFFDYDQDGDLDCYLLNNSFRDPEKIELFKSMRDKPDLLGGDKLYRNNMISESGGATSMTFTDVTLEAGMYSSAIGFGLGASIGDVNGDMLPDVYVSNDFWERDYLYINQGNGKFSEELIDRLDFTSISSMGGDIGDINNDGHPEVISTDMLAADNYRLKAMSAFDPFHLEDLKYRANYYYQMAQNCLHLNDGNGNFQEIAMLSGVAATDWSWGALLFDFENDGYRDLFVSNGIQRDLMNMDFRDDLSKSTLNRNDKSGKNSIVEMTQQMPVSPLSNYAFSNKGNLDFKNEATALGLGAPSFSNGASYGDLDNDGDMDLVINNVNSLASIYENHAERTANHYLKVIFEGPSANPQGIGAKVATKTSKGIHAIENYSSRGFQSSIEANVIVGVGDSETLKGVKITWPDGKVENLNNVKVDQTITVKYSDAGVVEKSLAAVAKPLFIDVTNEAVIGKSDHIENRYNDFDYEVLLLNMLSTEGPRIVKGDVNGDQLEDFIILGAKDDSDKLFIQNAKGQFTLKELQSFAVSRAFESTCGALADVDNDGDLDLMIGSGGNDATQDRQFYILRYYENDGAGNFRGDPQNSPRALGNFSTIQMSDFDKDGDLDMFVGGRAIPGNYGLPPQSFLFINDKGKWVDQTPEAIRGAGMVTDAAWADTDNDGDQDLIIVGDWMGIQLFNSQNGQLQLEKEIPNSKGMWNRIHASDLDGDGDVDYVIGNRGLNSKLTASPTKPLTMYVNDFDDNGKSEFIINWYAPLDSKAHPFATKPELIGQLPSLRSDNFKYEDYAGKTYETLIDQNIRSSSIKYAVNTLASSILWNENGSFILDELPVEAQLAPIYGITTTDYDKDGHQDIWVGGNLYEVKPQVGRHDASRGLLLKGNSDKSFSAISSSISGIDISGQVRDAVIISTKSGERLLVSRNNDAPILYKLK